MKPTPWTLLLAVLLALGCSERVVVGEGSDPHGGDDDTSQPDDDDVADDDQADDDDDDVVDTGDCGDEEWPELQVDVVEGCWVDPGQELWDLQITWEFQGDTNCGPVHVGRMMDANGDGAVDSTDPMQILSHQSMYTQAELISHEGVGITSFLADARTISASIGDVDPNTPGMEIVAAFDPTWDDDYDKLAMWDGTGATQLWMVDIALMSERRPWLTDLEGDGQVEVLSGSRVYDGLTGTTLAYLDGMPGQDTGAPIAADLDLDGTQEIIATSEYDAQLMGIFAPDGSLLHSCYTDSNHWSYLIYAVGDFDGDPEGEIVAAGHRFIGLYDSDCNEIATADHGAQQPSVLAVGELDGDPDPEIVIGDQPNGIFVLEHDLSLAWRWEHATPNISHYPFALADLDGDGLHEIYIRTYPDLVVLDGTGAEILTLTPNTCTCSSWIGAPAILDIDADGLAEIVMPAWPTVAVVENDFSGWSLEGSDEPWTWVEKFPGSRSPTGQVPDPSTRPWQSPSTNVWQALPVGSKPDVPRPDLLIGDIDVCISEDATHALVTAYVVNQGEFAVEDPVVCHALDPIDGAFLDDATLAPILPSGMAHPIQFAVAVDALEDGLDVVVDVLDDVLECDEGNNHGAWQP